MRMLATLLLCVAMTSASAAEPLVELQLKQDTMHPGESVTLQVVVLVPTWFRGPPVFPSFELPNLVARLPSDSSYPISRRIGNDTWSGITREYQLIPLVAGRFEVGGGTLRVRYAKPGERDPVTSDVVVPTAMLAVTVPDGAESLDPYLAGTDLTLSREILEDTGELEIGDAVRIVTRVALTGMPAIFIPPLNTNTLAKLEAQAGVRVYRDEARVGDGPAHRSETITLVFTGGGDYEVPSLTLSWWDLSSQTIKQAEVPALTLKVAGAPVATTGTEAAPDRTVGIALALVCVVILLASVLWLRRKPAPPPTPLALAWAALDRAVTAHDAAATYRALLSVVSAYAPGEDVRSACRTTGGDALLAAFDSLSATIYRGTGGEAGSEDLRQIATLMRQAFESTMRQREPALPPLNLA